VTDFQSLSTVALRRRAAYAGILSISGRSLKWARKADLIAALKKLQVAA
jgi:hypothetical protein